MSAIRRSAKGEACQVRLPGCHHTTDTTVWAHIRRSWNAGVGMKPPDLHGTYACDRCHSLMDGRLREPHMMRHEIELAAMDGHLRSILILKEKGLT